MIPHFLLQQAARVCHQGGVIAYPTESVFGLGCDPLDGDAVFKILQLKKRAVEKGLILIASDIEQLLPYIHINQQQIDKILSTSQATTWLVNKSKLTPFWVSGKHPKVAVRITQHPIARALCQHTGYPLVSTSANPSTLPAAKTRLMVRHYFSEQIDFLVPGDVGKLRKPTEIRDLDSDRILRQG